MVSLNLNLSHTHFPGEFHILGLRFGTAISLDLGNMLLFQEAQVQEDILSTIFCLGNSTI